MLNNYVPSYDFNLFTIPWISPLQAQEYGAETTFRANTPLPFVDYSLSVLQGLLDPKQNYPYTQSNFFQNPQGDSSYEAKVKAEVDKMRGEYEKRKGEYDALKGNSDCPAGTKRVNLPFGFSYCGKELHSDDTEGIAKSNAADVAKSWFDALPQGSGIFLIAVTAIVFLLLLVKR
jgi:hypothetical protein